MVRRFSMLALIALLGGCGGGRTSASGALDRTVEPITDRVPFLSALGNIGPMIDGCGNVQLSTFDGVYVGGPHPG